MFKAKGWDSCLHYLSSVPIEVCTSFGGVSKAASLLQEKSHHACNRVLVLVRAVVHVNFFTCSVIYYISDLSAVCVNFTFRLLLLHTCNSACTHTFGFLL